MQQKCMSKKALRQKEDTAGLRYLFVNFTYYVYS